MAFFRNLGVNLRDSLCGVLYVRLRTNLIFPRTPNLWGEVPPFISSLDVQVCAPQAFGRPASAVRGARKRIPAAPREG
jgi:hypothetical protein